MGLGGYGGGYGGNDKFGGGKGGGYVNGGGIGIVLLGLAAGIGGA